MPDSPALPAAQALATPVRYPRRRLTLARWRHRVRRRWRESKAIAVIVYHELLRTKAFDIAGGLAFWFMMSMIPLVMAVIALLSMLPVPTLVPQLLAEIAILVPASALSMVEQLIGNVLSPHSGVFSFGLLSYVWSSTSGFTSMITALNVAYDVKHERSWIRDRIRAVILTFTSGGLLMLSLMAIIAGPHFAHVLGQMVTIPKFLERLWPVIRAAAVFIAFVVALELCYFLGPNMRQRFRSTLPGALFATVLWFAGSFLLSFYLLHMAHYSRLYGGMGAVFGLMLWIYLTSLAIIVGGEMNAEIAKRRDSLFRGHLQANWGRRSSRPKNEAPDGEVSHPAA